MKQQEDHITIEFNSDLKFTAFSVLVLGYLKNFLNIDEENFFKIEIALREVINNAILHGNKSSLEKIVLVKFVWKKKYLRISVRDQNKNEVDFKEINKKLKNNDILSFNGRGLLIMKSYMDKVEFKSSEQGSEIIMEKHI
jgi:anti-sigma regulatory factor (Ser/Thr protein kinase)